MEDPTSNKSVKVQYPDLKNTKREAFISQCKNNSVGTEIVKLSIKIRRIETKREKRERSKRNKDR